MMITDRVVIIVLTSTHTHIHTKHPHILLTLSLFLRLAGQFANSNPGALYLLHLSPCYGLGGCGAAASETQSARTR